MVERIHHGAIDLSRDRMQADPEGFSPGGNLPEAVTGAACGGTPDVPSQSTGPPDDACTSASALVRSTAMKKVAQNASRSCLRDGARQGPGCVMNWRPGDQKAASMWR